MDADNHKPKGAAMVHIYDTDKPATPLTKFELMNANNIGYVNHGVCLYNNDLLIVQGGDLYAYRMDPDQGYKHYLVDLHVSDFTVSSMECLSDERVKLNSEGTLASGNSLILDADDIFKHRFNPSRYIKNGSNYQDKDKAYLFERNYEFGEYLIM
jgi:hypothetical protein